jgi:polyisoprenyl-teichoic acid--peptidoglycan teichoic acid transferase
VGTVTSRMAREEKPYRVYKGGRAKGKVPAPARPERGARARRGGAAYKGPGARRPRKRVDRRRRILLGLVALVALLVVWAVASFLSVRSGVGDANDRLDPTAAAALDSQSGLLLSHPTTILLLGTEHAVANGREGDRHSDSILLVHTDPGKHRIVYLSIPLDLRVPIPCYADQKINAAYQLGGPALAMKTIRAFTGLAINHVAIVDFADFVGLIDALGGVDVQNPAPILSNRFDCPYSTQARCQEWEGWRFPKGNIHLSGHKALIYSRVRENRLDPGESDVTRGERQQRVLQAVAHKLTSFGTLAKLPVVGGKLMKPLATDLTTGQFVQLGWLEFRASPSTTLHCRLGGEAMTVGGQAVIEPNEENRAVIAMVTGNSAAQPPPPGSGPFGPGCVVGDDSLG